jgi:hypothetical protein
VRDMITLEKEKIEANEHFTDGVRRRWDAEVAAMVNGVLECMYGCAVSAKGRAWARARTEIGIGGRVEGKQKGNGSGVLTFMAGGRLGFRGGKKGGETEKE